MKSYDPSKPLISIHIPKCAGASLSEVLRAWFKNGFRLHYHNEKRNIPPPRYKLYTGFFRKKPHHGLCIHGHFNNNRGNGTREYYPEVDQMISVMRDPFDLHLSTYFYVRRQAKNKGSGAYRSGQKHRIIENNWNLEDYLRETKRSYILNFLPSDLAFDNYRQIIEDQFLYIGISENLQQSVNILSKIIGFYSIAVPHSNVSEWDEPVPEGAREEFEENNRLETEIYRFVKSKWGNSE